ncbi:MAG TPA: hypothetical protein VL137_15620 [Polyangiaceae bacterium]|nr:hypothetical protein [Polyangiaceae bacterium]
MSASAFKRIGSHWRSFGILLLCSVAGYYYARYLNAAYSIRDWFIWPTLLLWAYNAVLFAAFTSAGMRVLRLLRVRGPQLEQFAFAVPIGVVVFCLGMYLIGSIGLFSLWPAVALAVLLIASGAEPTLRFARRAIKGWPTPDLADQAVLRRGIRLLALGYGALCLILLYLPVLTPQTLNFDSQWCHLTVAQDYAREGRLIAFDGDYARNHPQLASLIHTWGWLLPMPSLMQRWTMPLHTEFFIVVFGLPAIAAMARYLLMQRQLRMAWVGYFLFPAIFVYDMNIGGSSDHFFGFFIAPLFIAVARSAVSFDRRYLSLAAIFAAGALLTKYQAAYILPIMALVLVVALAAQLRLIPGLSKLKQWWRIRSRVVETSRIVVARQPVYNLLWATGLFCLLVSPHFIRNWICYHNPVYPFAQDFFHSTPSFPKASYYVENIFKDDNWRPHGTLKETLWESLQLTFTFSFSPHYYFFKPTWPNFGSLFTLSIPFLIFLKRSRRLWLGTLVCLGAVFLWAFTFRVDRNLQGFVPLIAATTIALLARAWELGFFARVGVVGLCLLQIAWGGDALFYSQYPRLDAAINLFRNGYEGSVSSRYQEHPLVAVGKTLPKNAKVLYHRDRPTLGLNRAVALDYIGSQGLFNYDDVSSLPQLLDHWRHGGLTHVMYDIGSQSSDSSRHMDILFHEFLRASGGGRSFGGYGVVDIRNLKVSHWPHDYQVISVGTPGYANGIYPLGLMNSVEDLPARFHHYPTPPRLLPTDDAGLREAFTQASAVLIQSALITDAIRPLLNERFALAKTLGGYFSIYLSKRSYR